MAATFTLGPDTFANILKNFYLGPIQDQLNEETLVCEMFEKASVDWNGRQVIIPVHVGRNQNVGYRAEGAALPGPAIGALGGALADAQDYQNLTVSAQFLYGRFQITGPAMAAAGKGGANSFVGWVDAEMNRLVNDIKVAANRAAVSGGTCVGFVTDVGVIAGAGNQDALIDGDPVKIAALVADNTANGVDLRRMDTYAPLDAANVQFAAGAVAGTVNITSPTGFTFPADAAGDAIPCAVIITAAGLGGVQVGALNLGAEPTGIYGNLGQNAHFGVDRTTATGTPALQCGDGAAAPTSNMHSTVTVTVTRTAIALGHLQTALDRQTLASDTEPDVILMNPLQRTRLAAIFQGQVSLDVGTTGAQHADGGFSGFSYAGIAIKTSRHVDNGLLLLLSTGTWKMAELESGKFADEDGDVLSRVGVLDAWEGFYKWYYEVVCLRPNANSVVTGLTL